MIKHESQSSGFTLLEVLIALTLFALVSAAMAPAFLGHFQRNTGAEIRSGAFAAAQQVLEELRLVDPGSLPGTGSSSPQNIVAGKKTYQVTTTYCTQSIYCTPRSRHLFIGVSHHGSQIYSVETVYARLR